MSDFNACGLEKCPYQIPYNMAEHEKIIYQQGREDVINGILNKLTDAQDTIPLVYGTYLTGYIEAIADIINVVEQMGEQKND